MDLAEINRWAARYRAAASFEAAKLAQYQTQETVYAYSELLRTILVWSAFERFLPIVGLSQKTSGDLLDKYNAGEVAEQVRELDERALFFTYIKSKVTNNTLRRELENYSGDAPFNTSYLLSAIRHIFGHGHLTPGANETDASRTAQICSILNKFHLEVMNSEFTAHVEGFKAQEARGWR